MAQKIFKAIPSRLSLKVRIGLTSIFIIITGCYYVFFYSPYLQELSSSEEKLYQTLKTTKDMQSLQGIEAKTTTRLFLHSIEKEDWNVSSLFYDKRDDGTIDTAFGPKRATPDVLKNYREMFIGEKDPFVQEGGKQSGIGYITLDFPMGVTFERKGGIWYIDSFNEQ